MRRFPRLPSRTSFQPLPWSACVARCSSCPHGYSTECTPEETRAMMLHGTRTSRSTTTSVVCCCEPAPICSVGRVGWRQPGRWPLRRRPMRRSRGGRRISRSRSRRRSYGWGAWRRQPFVGSASALHSGGSIESRVRHLLAPASPRRAKSGPLLRVALTLAVASSAIGVAIAAPSIHQVIERLVAVLP